MKKPFRKSIAKISTSVMLALFALNMSNIGSTSSYFIDTESSVGNTFSAGTWPMGVQAGDVVINEIMSMGLGERSVDSEEKIGTEEEIIIVPEILPVKEIITEKEPEVIMEDPLENAKEIIPEEEVVEEKPAAIIEEIKEPEPETEPADVPVVE